MEGRIESTWEEEQIPRCARNDKCGVGTTV
jgi:hypothetical protein